MNAVSKFDFPYRPLICAQVIRNGGRVVQNQVCLASARRSSLRELGRPAGFVLGVTLALLLFTLRSMAGW